MTRSRTALAPALLTAAALAAALTGCTADTVAAATATTGAAPATASPAPTVVVDDTATDDPACLVGRWGVSQDALMGFYADVTALTGGAATFTPEGTATLTVGADDSYAWAPDLTLTQTTGGVTSVVVLGGTVSGTATIDAGTIATDAITADDLVVSVTVGGASADPSLVADQITAAPLTDAVFACTQTTLTLDTVLSGGTARLTLDRL